MQSSDRHKEVQTIAELIKKGFYFYVSYGNEDMYELIEAINQRKVVGPISEVEKVMKRIHRDPDLRAVYMRSLLSINHLNSRDDNRNVIKFCKEVFVTMPEVIYTQKNFFLLDEINEKLNAFKKSGFIDYWSNSIKLQDENVNNLKTLS